MKIETRYNRIDRVIYRFDEPDIRNALEALAKITYKPGRRVEFDWSEDEGKLTATLTVVCEQEEPTNE